MNTNIKAGAALAFALALVSPPRTVLAGTGSPNTGDIIFQLQTQGQNKEGRANKDFKFKISWQSIKPPRKVEVTVQIEKGDTTQKVFEKAHAEITKGLKATPGVTVKYYKSAEGQDDFAGSGNWRRIHFENVTHVDVGAWFSALRVTMVLFHGVDQTQPNPEPGKDGPQPPEKPIFIHVTRDPRGAERMTGWRFTTWEEVTLRLGLAPRHPAIPGSGSEPWRSYCARVSDSARGSEILDQLESQLVADGFEVERLDETSLMILRGPDGSAVAAAGLTIEAESSEPVAQHWEIESIADLEGADANEGCSGDSWMPEELVRQAREAAAEAGLELSEESVLAPEE